MRVNKMACYVCWIVLVFLGFLDNNSTLSGLGLIMAFLPIIVGEK